MVRNIILDLLWFGCGFIVSLGGHHFGQYWGLALALSFYIGISVSIGLSAEDIIDCLSQKR